MIILGLDTSLTATGVAKIFTSNGTYVTRTLKPPTKMLGHERLAWIMGELDAMTSGVDVAAMEAPAYGAKGDAYHQLAGVWWMVAHHLWSKGIPTVSVAVDTLKLYAAGKGGVDKDQMMLRIGRAFEDFEGDNNAADALWLAQMAADHYGVPLATVAQKERRAALLKPAWPVLGGA